jgi:two-component system, OmpR family, KDP operon response regulator KdpE
VTATDTTILLVEDEPSMRRFLRASLGTHGYRVVETATGEEGLAQANARPPDLVLLDLGLPGIDGLEVTSRLRTWSTVPIVVLSARGLEEDKIRALDAGADDYLTKPFGVGELLARIRVALRHASALVQPGPPVFELGDVRIDLGKREVLVGGKEVHLTPIELKLLVLLAQNAGKVVTHRHLLREVWGPNAGTHTNYLRVYMGQLRHKLEAEPARPRFLLTEPGVGYRLREPPAG